MVVKQKEPVVSTQRIEAFSDAVFAIAVTLLALQLALPSGFTQNPTEQDLVKALLEESPSYFSFILSFVVIGRYWLAHHQMFSHIERSTQGLAMVNLFMLLAVVAMPFPTEILGEYGNLAASTIFYALSLSAVGLMSFAVWRYAVRHKLLYKDVSPAMIKLASQRSLVAPIIFLLSIPIALIDVSAAQMFWLLAFVVAIFLQKAD